jgi:hypothetical protein
MKKQKQYRPDTPAMATYPKFQDIAMFLKEQCEKPNGNPDTNHTMLKIKVR